jgi:NitT/TauT family transport system substrate-binding protein
MTRYLTWALGAVMLAALARPAVAEVNEIKIGKQYGLPYIQFVIMEDQKLIEKHARLQGLGDIKVDWATLGGPAQLNDGIISGAIDVAAVGLPNLITMWEKTRTNVKVRAIAGLNFMPLILLTRDPEVKTLKDYTDKDRIAVPSVKISMQAILLEMAASKEFGPANYENSTASPSRWAIRMHSRRSIPAAARSQATSHPHRSRIVSSRCPATIRSFHPTTSSDRIR